jgi:predicted transcriptional regulator
VTVQSDEFHDDIQSAITALERDERTDAPPAISFTSYDELVGTLTPRTLDHQGDQV